MIDLKLLESITGEEINKFQTYAEEHQVFEIFQDIIRQLAIHQPKDPILWMANHLDKKQVPSIVIIAPPTAMESKLCEELAKLIGAEYISTSQLLQAAIEKKSNLGIQAMPYFTKGQWVPDRVVMDVIALRLGHPDVQKSGYVLQGFPKTRTQFQLMQKRGWLPTFCLALEFSETWLRERELQTYPRSSPSAALSEEGLQGLDALHHQATIQRLQTYQFHLQQLLSSSKSWIQVPIPYFNSFHHQLVTLAKTIHQRPPYRIPPVHRIYLVGGTHEQRHAISVMLESHYRLVYVSLQRLFLDTPTMDPSTLPMDQLVLKLKDLVSSPSLKTSGYVVNLEWTPTLIEESLNLPSPNRVIYIQGEGQVELYSCLVKCYKRMEHPLFYSVPTNGKLHEFQPTSDLIEKVRQGLLTPIPYWSAFCYLERKEKDEESESKKTYE